MEKDKEFKKWGHMREIKKTQHTFNWNSQRRNPKEENRVDIKGILQEKFPKINKI